MSEPSEFEDLVAYLVRTTRLSEPEAVRLVDEVLSFLDSGPRSSYAAAIALCRARGSRTARFSLAFRPSSRAGGFARLPTASASSGA